MRYRRWLVSILSVCGMLLLSALGSARPDRVNQVPRNEWTCKLCHVNRSGSGPRNAFGRQIEERVSAAGDDVPWKEIYDLDADGDGYTNGEELHDPNGNWEVGDDRVSGPVTHPGQKDDTPCGNGTLEGPETCDGSNLNGATCKRLGHESGTLACTSTCRFDTSGCRGSPPDVGLRADVVGSPNDRNETESSNAGGGDAQMGGEGGCSTIAGEEDNPVEHGLIVILTLIGACLAMLYRRIWGTSEDNSDD